MGSVIAARGAASNDPTSSALPPASSRGPRPRASRARRAPAGAPRPDTGPTGRGRGRRRRPWCRRAWGSATGRYLAHEAGLDGGVVHAGGADAGALHLALEVDAPGDHDLAAELRLPHQLGLVAVLDAALVGAHDALDDLLGEPVADARIADPDADLDAALLGPLELGVDAPGAAGVDAAAAVGRPKTAPVPPPPRDEPRVDSPPPPPPPPASAAARALASSMIEFIERDSSPAVSRLKSCRMELSPRVSRSMAASTPRLATLASRRWRSVRLAPGCGRPPGAAGPPRPGGGRARPRPATPWPSSARAAS